MSTPDNLWGEVPTEPAEPIAFTTARKDLLNALSRTQHAIATDDERPVLQAWWLAVEDGHLVIHAADNYRIARSTIDVIATLDGRFGIHRSEAKAILAFLASGPSDVSVDVSGGAWAITHDEGRLSGKLWSGTPPDWSKFMDALAEPTVRFVMNGRFAADAARFAVSEGGTVTVEFESPERPVVYRSESHFEVVIPVRVGGGVS